MLVLAQTCVEWSCFLFSAENKLAQVSSASRLVQVSWYKLRNVSVCHGRVIKPAAGTGRKQLFRRHLTEYLRRLSRFSSIKDRQAWVVLEMVACSMAAAVKLQSRFRRRKTVTDLT